MKTITPENHLESLVCPHCGEYSSETFWTKSANDKTVKVSKCDKCSEISIWYCDSLMHPSENHTPAPSLGMPDEVKKDYEEAASIFPQSPRSAAALLRLAIQKLCCELGGKGEDIEKDIQFLVKNGLPTIVEQSLEVVRVIGSKSVRPGQIDTDNPIVTGCLFTLVNVITDHMTEKH